MSTQVDNGRAFEWAVAIAIRELCKANIEENSYSHMANRAFDSMSSAARDKFNRAGKAAIHHVFQKENVPENVSAAGRIRFNSDASGKAGDVRDVLLIHGEKTLGFSCKNNHEAMKHSRLSARLDFVKKWGIDDSGCSATYKNAVVPVFEELRRIKKESGGKCLWSDITDKADRFYWPILDAWSSELDRIAKVSPEMQSKLCRGIVSYLVGKFDFYKLVCEGSNAVQIQAWNFNNTLATKRTRYPDCINAINNRNGGQYSKTVVFNHGYSINFRIHSASSRVEPSLKFDIKAIGLPSEVYRHSIDT